MEKLLFTTVTNSGVSREIEFTLHAETSSAQNISVLVTEILKTLSTQIAEMDSLKDGDILQALSMVSAIRCGMLGADPQLAERLILGLFKQNFVAVQNAKKGFASRA